VSAGRYRDQIAAALAAVAIHGPARYAWLGRAGPRIPASVEDDMDDAERRRHLVACLREELYFSFYCHGRPVPARWGAPEPPSGDPWLLEAMSQANSGSGSWESGWIVERLDGDDVVATRSRLRVRVPVEDCSARAGVIRPGAAASVRLPKELPAQSPGFWTVVSDTAADPASAEGDVRVYWNITRDGAAPLVSALSTRLNRDAMPFRLKVADHPFRLERCDAAVLYLQGGAFRAVRRTLGEIATALTTRLRPQIPAFTLPLVPGVGLAEDDRGESFGIRRCGLLADAIVRGHEDGLTRFDEQLDAVAARFAEDGVLIDAPYLEPSLAGRHVL
jgi:HopA1 effector protein family